MMLFINSLREQGIPGRFISIFHEGVDFCDFLFACTPDPFQKVWRLFCRYLFLVYPSFGAPGGLCLVTVAFLTFFTYILGRSAQSFDGLPHITSVIKVA